MADFILSYVDTALDAGPNFATDRDTVTSIEYPISKIAFGPLDTFTLVTGSAGLPVEQQTGSSWSVDVASSALPTGAATAANQSTGNTALSAIQTAVELIDDPVATIGTTPLMRVGIFDAADSQITSFGGGVEYTEDAAAPADPVGKAIALVRQDTPAGIASADGDIVAQRATNFGAAFCQIVDSSGNFVDTFGGGTQYTEGATDASITGTAMMMEGAADTLVPAQGTVAGGLLVDLGANNDVTVTGSVSLAAAIPAGGNTIGGVNVVSTIPGTGATNLGKAEDAPHVSGDTGVMMLAVRSDTAVSLVSANGDYAPLQTNGVGSLRVDLTTTTAAATNIAKLEDSAHASGHTGVFVLAVRNDTRGTMGDTNGDYVPFQVNSSGDLRVDGSAVTQPVSGTVTANAGTNLNTSALALETGGNLATIAGAIGGTEMQVDVVASLPAGTNNIGDVDVVSIVPGTGPTNLGKAVDDVAGATDTGVAMLAVRDDALSALTPIDGDYTHLRVNSQGALHVTGGGGGTEYVEDDAAPANPTAAALSLVRQDTPAGLTTADGDILTQRGTNFGAAFCQILDSSGNFIDTFGGSGGTAQADKSSFTEGTTTFTPVGGVFNETIASNPTEDQAAAARITEFRALHVNSRDALGNQAMVPGSNSNHLGKLEDGPSTTGATGVFVLAVRNDTPGSLVDTNGDYAAFQINATGALYCDAQNVVPGTGATNLGKAVDDVAGGTDTGIAVLAVRDDALTTLTPADGDYVPLRVSSTGALHVTGGGGGTEYNVNDAAPVDPVGATFVMERDDALSALTEIEGDWTNPRANANGALWVAGDGTFSISGTVTANAGTNLNTSTLALESGGNLATIAGAVGGTEMQVDVVAALPAGTNNIGDVDVLTLPAEVHSADFDTGAGTDTTLAFGIAVPASGGAAVVPGSATAGLKVDLGADNDVTVTGNVTVDVNSVTPDLMLGTDFSDVFGTASLVTTTQADDLVNTTDGVNCTSLSYVFDGTTWDRMRGDATDGVLVNLGANNDVTVTGTVTANAGTGTFTVDLGANNDVHGTVAHDGADSGNPVKIGARARSTDITAVATDDRTDLLADLLGKLIVRSHCIPESQTDGTATATGTADTSVIAAPGAGLRLYITEISVRNTSSTDSAVDIKSATTTRWRTANPANGGSNMKFDPPLRLGANEALNMASTTAVTTAGFSANGYIGV